MSIIKRKNNMICIAGKNNLAVNIMDHLVRTLNISNSDLMACPCKNDDGTDGWQKSLRHYAQCNGIPVTTLEECYDCPNLVFISCQFDRIVKTSLFSSSQLYNVHFAPLPKYKGVYTSIWPILNGDTTSGVTLHRIDDGIDTGDIIDQIIFDIGIDDTAEDLYSKYTENGTKIVIRNLEKLLSATAVGEKQPCIGSTYYSRMSLDLSNISIDLNKTAYEIHNQLRAYIFPAYQLPTVSGRSITKSVLIDRYEPRRTQQITMNKNSMLIQGIDGYFVEAFFLGL